MLCIYHSRQQNHMWFFFCMCPTAFTVYSSQLPNLSCTVHQADSALYVGSKRSPVFTEVLLSLPKFSGFQQCYWGHCQRYLTTILLCSMLHLPKWTPTLIFHWDQQWVLYQAVCTYTRIARVHAMPRTVDVSVATYPWRCLWACLLAPHRSWAGFRSMQLAAQTHSYMYTQTCLPRQITFSTITLGVP